MADKTINGDIIHSITGQVAAEVRRAMTLHPAQSSEHGAYAVMLEEVDELWDEIKERNVNLDGVYAEAIQVAAMAVRLIYDSMERGTE